MKWSLVSAVASWLLIAFVAAPATASDSADEARQIAAELAEHADPEVRVAALAAIGYLGDDELRQQLEIAQSADRTRERLAAGVGMILSGDDGGTAFAAEQLREASDVDETLRELSGLLTDEQLDALIAAALRDASDDQRAEIFGFLAAHSGPLYDRLTSYLTGGDAETRSQALEAVVEHAREETLEVAESLRTHSDPEVRRQLFAITERLQHRRDLRNSLIELLQRAMGDSSPELSQKAARQLVVLGEESGAETLVGVLSGATPDRRVEVAKFLLEHDASADFDAIQPLIEQAEQSGDDDRELERRVLYELAATNATPEFADELIEKFSSTDFDDRLVSVRSLGRLGTDEARDLLVRGLGEGRSDIRLYSARGLGHIADPDTLGRLRSALTSERDQEVRLQLVDTVGQIDDAAATSVLRFLVTDDDPDVRMAIIDALDEIGLPESVQALEMLNRDRDSEISWRAFVALLRVDPQRAKNHIGSALRRPPAGFADELDPSTLSTTGREVLYEGLLSHSTSRVWSVGVEGVATHRDLLMPVAAEVVLSGGIEEPVRHRLLHLLAAGEEVDEALFGRVATGYPQEAAARYAVWMMAQQPSSAFEDALDELVESTGDESAIRIAAMVARSRTE